MCLNLVLSWWIAAFFFSVSRILLVNDHHSSQTWGFPRACQPVPLMLFGWWALPRGAGGTPLMLIISQRAACLRKEEPRRRVRSSKNKLRAAGGCEGEVRSGLWTETEHCVCKEKCSLADTYGVLQDFCSAHFRVSRPNRSSSQTPDDISPPQRQTKQPNCFSLPSLCPPLSLRVLLQTNVHVLGWQRLSRRGKTMLCHKQKLLFRRKRKFLKFNFLLKFIFNDPNTVRLHVHRRPSY